MSRILHISDLHFGRERPALVAALARQIAALEPDLVVASGDLTQRARPRELAAAAAFIGALPGPVLVVPGNHDIPGVTARRFFDPWGRWLSHFRGGLEPVFESADLLAVGATSARCWGPYLDWSRGRFGRAQIERIAARVAAAAGRLRLLAVHHPLLLTAAGAHRGLIARSDLALTRFRQAGLDLVLGGHVHLGYSGVADGVVVVHAGTAVSSRLVGEANSFNLIDGNRAALAVEPWYWHGHAFAPAARIHFRRTEAGWRAATSRVGGPLRPSHS